MLPEVHDVPALTGGAVTRHTRQPMTVFHILASTPAGAPRGSPPVVQNNIERMCKDSPDRWEFCPVNYKDRKDGSESKHSQNWFEGWYDMHGTEPVFMVCACYEAVRCQ